MANPAACHTSWRNSDCQFSSVEEKNCGRYSDQLNDCPCCSASLRCTISWKMNWPAHDTRKKAPVMKPNEYAFGMDGRACRPVRRWSFATGLASLWRTCLCARVFTLGHHVADRLVGRPESPLARDSK